MAAAKTWDPLNTYRLVGFINPEAWRRIMPGWENGQPTLLADAVSVFERAEGQPWGLDPTDTRSGGIHVVISDRGDADSEEGRLRGWIQIRASKRLPTWLLSELAP